MSQLTGTTFENKYNNVTTGLFKTNTSKDIGSDDTRTLVTDIKDSYANKSDTLGTSGVFGVLCQVAADLSDNTIVWDGISTGLFGSGSSGAIAKGNIFIVGVGGTIPSAFGGLPFTLNPGALLIALVSGIVDADIGDTSKVLILNN